MNRLAGTGTAGEGHDRVGRLTVISPTQFTSHSVPPHRVEVACVVSWAANDRAPSSMSPLNARLDRPEGAKETP